MTKIDQFESVFKASDKTPFRHEEVRIRKVLTVTDMDEEQSREYQSRVREFLEAQDAADRPRWELIGADDSSPIGPLLQRVREAEPDLICIYRNLHIPATEYPYSLGVHVDVLTQETTTPVLVLPHPVRVREGDGIAAGRRSVMAVTDHLTGDHHLVSCAVRFTPPGGKLLLTHVEDQATFQRYMNVISKVPSIDTESASHDILEQLLKEPRDYIKSCEKVLRDEGVAIDVESIVSLGRHLNDYKRLVSEHQVGLMVLNTKDEEQLAMHGVAYPLTVELRETPLLLL